MTTTYRLIVTLTALLFLSLSGGMACDQLTGADGPTTSCVRGYDATVTAQDFGQACTDDSECAHASCLMPNADGNIGDAASIASSDPDYHCVYPGGCFVSTSQGTWRYAAPKCSDVSDCEAIDARYTDCATTDQKTVLEDTCGSLTKVCQAHAN
jgi:hypothetical protein